MVKGAAVLSPCGTYRYALERQVGDDLLFASRGAVLFVMLNPSTADTTTDDPTIRRCIGFARSWQFRTLLVGNLYAWRATDPRQLTAAYAIVGPDNDAHLLELARRAELIVCAWGADPMVGYREPRVAALLASVQPLHCLGTTKDGHPNHPLYLSAALRPSPWFHGGAR